MGEVGCDLSLVRLAEEPNGEKEDEDEAVEVRVGVAGVVRPQGPPVRVDRRRDEEVEAAAHSLNPPPPPPPLLLLPLLSGCALPCLIPCGCRGNEPCMRSRNEPSAAARDTPRLTDIG